LRLASVRVRYTPGWSRHRQEGELDRAEPIGHMAGRGIGDGSATGGGTGERCREQRCRAVRCRAVGSARVAKRGQAAVPEPTVPFGVARLAGRAVGTASPQWAAVTADAQ